MRCTSVNTCDIGKNFQQKVFQEKGRIQVMRAACPFQVQRFDAFQHILSTDAEKKCEQLQFYPETCRCFSCQHGSHCSAACLSRRRADKQVSRQKEGTEVQPRRGGRSASGGDEARSVSSDVRQVSLSAKMSVLANHCSGRKLPYLA